MIKHASVIFASLIILSACTKLGDTRPDRPPINCDPIPYPAPLIYAPLNDEIINKGSHWELSHDGWSILIQRNHETERYLKDINALIVYMNTCIDAYNDQQPAEDEPDQKSWWQIWD